jgi:hypothetical protein
VNERVGYMEQLKDPAVVLILSLFCSLIPKGGIVMLCSAVILAHFYAISPELAILALICFLLMFCLYIRFDTNDSYAILLIPLLFWIKLPYLAPVAIGLVGGFVAAVPVAFGVFIYYFLAYVSTNAPSLTNSTVETMLEKVRLIIDGMMENDVMILTMVAFAITVTIVRIIRNLPVDYAWTIAVGVGIIVDMVILLVGDFSLDISTSVSGVIVGSLIAAAILLVAQYFIFSVDYSRTERVQFEDDDYVYYVKVVPKASVTAPEVNVKRINEQKPKKSAVRKDS